MFEVLKVANITQADFALLTKVSRITVNAWVSGKSSPNGAREKTVKAWLYLINRAVQTGNLPLPSGCAKQGRIDHIRAALKKTKDAIQ